jgi:peptidoglycan pentaglycine glycine transferase (the first glycine)
MRDLQREEMATPDTTLAGASEEAPRIPIDAERAAAWKSWDTFLEAESGTGFMQSSWWADFRSTVGFGHFAAIVRSRGSIVGGALVQRFMYDDDRCFYYMQDGPVLPTDRDVAREVFARIMAEIDERRATDPQTVSHLRLEPRWEITPPFLNEFPTLTVSDKFTEPRTTLCVNLRPTLEEILLAMKPKGRYNIRLATRHRVAIMEDSSPRGLDDFHRIYTSMADYQKIDAKPFEYFQDLLAVISIADRGSIYFAEYCGERIAAALVIYFGQRATYFYGGSLPIHRNVMAPYLLHYEIMRAARQRGCAWYDFWGIAPDDNIDHPWRDITAFKRKFGGVDVTLVPTLDYILNGGAYERYGERYDTRIASFRSVHEQSHALDLVLHSDAYSGYTRQHGKQSRG